VARKPHSDHNGQRATTPTATPDDLVDRTLRAIRLTSIRGHVLLAEDDEEFLALVEHALKGAGYRVTTCSDGVELADHIGSYVLTEATDNFDLIISDIRMPGISGMQVLQGMSKWKGFPPMILMTAFGDHRTHDAAQDLGAAAMLDKPFEIDDLVELVNEVLSRAEGKPAG
jgi:DNA-binding response OmpR family regulator